MTKVERIEKMLETEQSIRSREDAEVTVDFASVRAEIRIGCIEEVLEIVRALEVQ